MENNETDWNEPFVPGKLFYASWALISIPVLFFTRPWEYELPLYSRIACMLFYPFAATIVVYVPIAFVEKVIRGGREGRRGLLIFLSCMGWVMLAVLLSLLSNGGESVWPWTGLVVSAGASVYLNYKLSKPRKE